MALDGETGLQTAGYVLVLLCHAAYAAYLLRAGRLKRAGGGSGRWFLAAILATFAWGAAGLLDQYSDKRWTWHLATGLDHLRFAAWSGFLLLLLAPADGSAAGGRLRLTWRLLPVMVLASFGVNAWIALQPGDWPRATYTLALVQLGWSVLGLLLVEQVFRNQVDPNRWAAKPLCLALGGLYAFDVYLYAQVLMVGSLDLDASQARALVHAMAVPLLLVASRRQSHWLTRLKVSNSAAFYSASLLLVGLYLVFVSAAGYYVRYVGGTWGGALQITLVFAALVLLSVLVMSGEMRARVRVFVGKHFFRYRYDYRIEWLRFTAMLSTKSGPQEVGQLVVRGLADLVESPGGGLWFKALGDDHFVPSALWNLPETPAHEPPDSPFCQALLQREWIFELPAEERRHGDPTDDALLPDWIKAIPSGWIVVPLIVADGLIGFVVLLRPRARLELNWEVRDILKTAARQAAGFLAQMHAAEALLEARKFDAFNRMSAFVVHDLKNIVTQLSLMLKNAERHKDNPEFQADMLATVESSLDKMRQMMLQLREGNRPAGPSSGVDLPRVLQRIEASARQRGRALELDLIDRISTRGHEERLERVLGHVVQNALDATQPPGRVWVTLQQVAGRAVVQVGDEGVGMSPEFIQTRLFRPFNSTKASGMGIGTYESFQYVKELGGMIDVQSELGRGTTVTIQLPLFELRTTSDLQTLERA